MNGAVECLFCYAQIHEVPQKSTRRLSPVCKSKEPLFYASLQTRSLHVQYTGIKRDPQAQLE